jgi:hypothetical protein
MDLIKWKKSQGISNRIQFNSTAIWGLPHSAALQFGVGSSPFCTTAIWGVPLTATKQNGEKPICHAQQHGDKSPFCIATKWGFIPILHSPKVQKNQQEISPICISPFCMQYGENSPFWVLLTHCADRMGKQIGGRPGFPKEHISTKWGTCTHSNSNACPHFALQNGEFCFPVC